MNVVCQPRDLASRLKASSCGNAASGTRRIPRTLSVATGVTLAAACGLALALSIQRGSSLGLLAVVPMLAAASRGQLVRCFVYPWLVGATTFAILLRPAIVPFGVVGNSHFSHLAQLIIIASLEGAFIGGAVAVAPFVTRRVGFPLMLTLPVAWVAQEWARGVFPWGGLPWGFLGYAAVHDLRLIQFAEFTGAPATIMTGSAWYRRPLAGC